MTVAPSSDGADAAGASELESQADLAHQRSRQRRTPSALWNAVRSSIVSTASDADDLQEGESSDHGPRGRPRRRRQYGRVGLRGEQEEGADNDDDIDLEQERALRLREQHQQRRATADRLAWQREAGQGQRSVSNGRLAASSPQGDRGSQRSQSRARSPRSPRQARQRGSSMSEDPWHSLAHLLLDRSRSRPAGEVQATQAEQQGPASPQQAVQPREQDASVQSCPPARSSVNVFGSSTFITEPASYIDAQSPATIPIGEDPLEYVDDSTRLLDEDFDNGEQGQQQEAQARRLAVQERDITLKRFGGFAALADLVLWAQSVREPLVQSILAASGSASGEAPRRRVLSNVQRGIIKCVTAYLLASMFTFIPYLAGHLASLLPNHDPDKLVPISNLHLIATVAVYFHPAKTIGAMLEADLFAVGGWLYALSLSVLSMATAVFLHDRELAALSNAIIITVFLAGGMGLLAWSKVRLASPTFNTTCSMINIIIFTCIVREGSAHLGRFSTDKIVQTTLCIITGALVSNVVCFTLWPRFATTSLQADIRRNLTGFGTLLKVLTKTFLLDEPDAATRPGATESAADLLGARIQRAIDDHHASFLSLKRNLHEARLERPFDARIRGASDAYSDVTDSLNRLAQHLAGLRSSCGLQQRIMAKRRESAQERADGSGTETVGHNSSEAEAAEGGASTSSPEGKADKHEPTRWRARRNAFDDFVETMGPHMRSLVFTCNRTLVGLRSAFLTAGDVALPEQEHPHAAFSDNPPPQRHNAPGGSFEDLAHDLKLAIRRFKLEQTVSIKRIYESTIYHEDRSADKAFEEIACDIIDAGSSSGDDGAAEDDETPLIFSYAFNLDEFAQELQTLVAAMERVRAHEEQLVRKKLMGWREWARTLIRERRRRRADPASRPTPKPPRAPLDFPHFAAHQVDTAQSPRPDSLRMRFSQLVWSVGRVLKRPDVKFGVKAGIGCALLAAPAFIHQTRSLFVAYKGQWGLVSYMVVMSPTVGQTNLLSVQRTLGSLLGAVVAVAAYSLFPDNNVALPIIGALFSVPCFWLIVGHPTHASAGRFVLLTYNLTALYSFVLRKTDVEVHDIAFKRVVSVVIGVVWATFIMHAIRPTEARRQLADGISDLILKLGWLYHELALNSDDLDDHSPKQRVQLTRGNGVREGDGELQPLLGEQRDQPTDDQFQRLEIHLQIKILKLEGLLAQTKHEPRLKGPFPTAKYRSMLLSCQAILDKLHSMRCVTRREDWQQQVHRDFVIPMNAYRREMIGNVLLCFYILGSAFKLKSPLPPYLPPAEKARRILLEKIRSLPVVRRRQVQRASEWLLWYSYALATKDIIQQLEHIGRVAQSNFGVLGGSVEAFEQQFRLPAEP